jgi:hypothetical protein
MNNEQQKLLTQCIILTGEKERTKDWARQKLIECGWRQRISLLCAGKCEFD